MASAASTRSIPRTEHASAKQWLTALAEGVAAGKINRSFASHTPKTIKTLLAAHQQEVTAEVVTEIREDLNELRRRVEGGAKPWQ